MLFAMMLGSCSKYEPYIDRGTDTDEETDIPTVTTGTLPRPTRVATSLGSSS